MLTENISKLRLICKLTDLTNSVRITWSGQSLQVVPRRRLLRSKLYSNVHLLLVLITFGQVAVTQEMEFSPMAKLQIAYTLAIHTMGSIMMWTCHEKADDIVLFVNGPLQFDSRYNSGEKFIWKRTLLEKLNVWLVTSCTISTIILPLCVYGFHWSDPCKPSLAGYWLLGKCKEHLGGTPAIECLLKAGVLLANHWLWTLNVQVCTFVLDVVFVLGTLTLRDLLRTFSRKMSKRYHAFRDVAPIYRHVQLLGSLCNEVQSGILLPNLTVGAILTMSLASTALIKQVGKAHALGETLLFSLSGFDTLFALVVMLGGMVGVYVESKKVLREMRVRPCVSKSEEKYRAMYHASCCLIKVKLGSSNFLEELTPLNCVDFSVDLTVQFLLLSGSQ